MIFKTLPIADCIRRERELPGGYHRDTLTLGWEDRLKVRGRRRSDGGIEFGLALPRGTVLREGDSLVLTPLSLVVAVVERPEPVFVLEAATPEEWGLWGYQIGNCHQPIMIAGNAMICPDLPGIEQILQLHRIRYVRAIRPFTPTMAVVDHASR